MNVTLRDFIVRDFKMFVLKVLKYLTKNLSAMHRGVKLSQKSHTHSVYSVSTILRGFCERFYVCLVQEISRLSYKNLSAVPKYLVRKYLNPVVQSSDCIQP